MKRGGTRVRVSIYCYFRNYFYEVGYPGSTWKIDATYAKKVIPQAGKCAIRTCSKIQRGWPRSPEGSRHPSARQAARIGGAIVLTDESKKDDDRLLGGSET